MNQKPHYAAAVSHLRLTVLLLLAIAAAMADFSSRIRLNTVAGWHSVDVRVGRKIHPAPPRHRSVPVSMCTHSVPPVLVLDSTIPTNWPKTFDTSLWYFVDSAIYRTKQKRDMYWLLEWLLFVSDLFYARFEPTGYSSQDVNGASWNGWTMVVAHCSHSIRHSTYLIWWRCIGCNNICTGLVGDDRLMDLR